MSETQQDQFFNITIKDEGEEISVKAESECDATNLIEAFTKLMVDSVGVRIVLTAAVCNYWAADDLVEIIKAVKK